MGHGLGFSRGFPYVELPLTTNLTWWCVVKELPKGTLYNAGVYVAAGLFRGQRSFCSEVPV